MTELLTKVIIKGEVGERYNRLVTTRGNDYLMVYNYSGRSMEINLSKISGKTKKCWWYNPRTGEFKFIGEWMGRKL